MLLSSSFFNVTTASSVDGVDVPNNNNDDDDRCCCLLLQQNAADLGGRDTKADDDERFSNRCGEIIIHAIRTIIVMVGRQIQIRLTRVQWN